MYPRVSWPEIRRNEITGYASPYQVIADLEDGVWAFADQESGEISWFHLDSTPELVKKANELLKAISAEIEINPSVNQALNGSDCASKEGTHVKTNAN